MWDVIQNRRVLFGAGQLERVPETLQALLSNKPVFVLAFNANGQAVARLAGLLAASGIKYMLDNSLHGEPSVEDVNRIAQHCISGDCGAVLAMGGGSVLDAAKAVAMLATNGGYVEQYQMDGKPIDKPALPLIAIPTTAGTGSEATKVSVVYNTASKLKKSFYSPYMIADTVILDPELTVSMPKSVTVNTGIDALSHAIESFVSLNATDYTEMYGLKAMRLIRKSLKRAVEQPDDIEARGDMLLASYLGGCALNAGIGLAHIIGQPLGGLLNIPHGLACAVFLPYAMEYNVEYNADKYARIAHVFGAKGTSGIEAAREGICRVKEFLKELDAPDNISAYAADGFDLDYATDAVMAATGHIKCNPRPVDRDIIYTVIKSTIK